MQTETCPGSDVFEWRCSFSNFSSSKPYELQTIMKVVTGQSGEANIQYYRNNKAYIAKIRNF